MIQTIGIAGGGQLGRMLTDAAHTLGFKVVVLDPTENSPAGQVADKHIVGDFRVAGMVRHLASLCDVLTYEIESVSIDALHELSTSMHFPVHPTPDTLLMIMDKLKQKEFLTQKGIPVAPFVQVDDEAGAREAGRVLGYPFVLKARSGGYDGRGNATVEREEDIPHSLTKLGGAKLYAEKWVPFEKELAIIAARTTANEIAVYPLVETIHKDHICHTVLAPAPVSESVAQKAHDLAKKVLGAFDGAGVFGIEMFLADGEVLVNEIAPRVHNSGHFTIEACETSQFEQHIRAVVGLPLGSVAMKAPAAVMVNILGDRSGVAEPRGVADAESLGGVGVHIYGKIETRPARKMGHLTAVGATLEEAREKAEKAHALISI